MNRPALAPYYWTTVIGGLVWATVVVTLATTAETGTAMTSTEIGYMGRFIVLGVGGIAALAALAFSGHWAFKAIAAGLHGKHVPVEMGSPAPETLDERTRRTWSLELRGVGITPGEEYQTTVWEMIRKKHDNFSSIYSQNPKDYPDSAQHREDNYAINTGAAFKYAATDSVAYWPIPAFAVEPPDNGKRDIIRAAGLINGGRNKGSLGVTLFLWQQDANTLHAQAIIEDLFEFFDTHAEVPMGLIASRDGEVMRDRYRPPGTPSLPNEHYVPKIIDTTAALLVARSDRVDRYLRPYAPDYRENNQDTRTDLGKLWSYFFETETQSIYDYRDEARKAGATSPTAPGTMPTAYWQAALPALWQQIDNRGPGQFKPTPWLPIRWAKHQVDEFDRAPRLGHLHRPIKVSLRGADGKPLKQALQTQAIIEGWQQALATLPEGSAPVRVFHDSHDGTELGIALHNALHALNTDGHGLELGNVDEGYDIGRRIGDVGVSSALVQIGLGAIASYHDGGVSAVVYAGDDGSASIQMVRPPSAEEKAKNFPDFNNIDPFMRRVPR